MTPPSVAVIVNPISGTACRAATADRKALADTILTGRGFEAHVAVTESADHATVLTRTFVAQGVSCVVAWGGDGTINQIASVLAFTPTALAIVPSGSGNGLARELGIPFEPSRALAAAIDGYDRAIDAGELDGHLFFNVAGIGLDARIAREFAARGAGHRGIAGYLRTTIRELQRYRAAEHTVVTDEGTDQTRPLMMAIANSRQYGNGALIAPDARIDDGLLDVVIIEDRAGVKALMRIPQLFLGQIGRVPGVRMRRTRTVVVTAARSVLFHVDGEPRTGGVEVRARVHPLALRVRIPRN